MSWMSLPFRIRSRLIENENGCWIWSGHLDADGYGRVRYDNLDWRAHRLFWVMEHGPFPEGTEASHICNERACVRPFEPHVIAETHLENMQRREDL